PLAPESDEEKGEQAASTEGGGRGRGGRGGPGGGGAATPAEPPKPVRIDFDKIQQRTIAIIALPPRDYRGMASGKAGLPYVLEPCQGGRGGFGGGLTLTKFDLKTRKTERLADNLLSFDLSANGEKMLVRTGGAAGGRGGRGGGAAPQYYIAS